MCKRDYSLANARDRKARAARGLKPHVTPSMAGKRHSAATKGKIAAVLKAQGIRPPPVPMASRCRGANHYRWKGGVTPANDKARRSPEYRAWRLAVFARDNFTCVQCGTKDRSIQADHIKPFARFPELRYDVSNGRTLCGGCHKETPTYGVNVDIRPRATA